MFRIHVILLLFLLAKTITTLVEASADESNTPRSATEGTRYTVQPFNLDARHEDNFDIPGIYNTQQKNTFINYHPHDKNIPLIDSNDNHYRFKVPAVNNERNYENYKQLPFNDVYQGFPQSYYQEIPEFYRSSSGSSSFNMEGSEVIDSAFIIPDEKNGEKIPLPVFEQPKKSYATTVNDGQVNFKDIRKDDGEYIISYTSADGTKRKETGKLELQRNGQKVLVIRGTYVFSTPDGQKFRVDYKADTDGFRIINRKPIGNQTPSIGATPTGGRPGSEVRPETETSPENQNFNNGPSQSETRPESEPNNESQNTPSRPSWKPTGAGRPTPVKPSFDIPNTAERPRPNRPGRPTGSKPNRLKPNTSTIPQNRPNRLRPRPSKPKPVKVRQPIKVSKKDPLTFILPTQNTVNSGQFIIDYYPFYTNQG